MRNLGLFYKFAGVILIVGLFPMLILATFVSNKMMKQYEESVRSNYEQAVAYLGSSLESLLSSYNNITKTIYQYTPSYGSGRKGMIGEYDNLRQVLDGVGLEPEQMELNRESEMEEGFLKNLQGVDAYIYAVHFVGLDSSGKQLDFHYSARNTYFRDESDFETSMGWENWDQNSKNLIVVPTHLNSYYNEGRNPVFTLARNYFDLRGSVGNERYRGTVFLDIDIERLKLLFRTMRFSGQENFYVADANGYCLYSNETERLGADLSGLEEELRAEPEYMAIESRPNEYGIRVIVTLDREQAFAQTRKMQKMMYLILGAAFVSVAAGSLWFSRRLTGPIHAMMGQMSQIENGNFDIELPVRSRDETGVLAERFNQMSAALKQYINQSYVAQIKQNEAELTALKAQIYPHFLYNTLEIIRMSALENGDMAVSRMIEALSRQIHYLIGPMQDMVPLEKEIDIVRGYVYLLNCRIAGKVQLMVSGEKTAGIFVPKLILQPIVENAYVHGIKPKSGSGSILIEIARKTDAASEFESESESEPASAADPASESAAAGASCLEITVMDNGAGMSEEERQRILKLLAGDEIGIKNEYNWQSIGMKNVHDRIRYLYGEAYGIQVTSTPGVGTMVRILMPFIETNGNGGNV